MSNPSSHFIIELVRLTIDHQYSLFLRRGCEQFPHLHPLNPVDTIQFMAYAMVIAIYFHPLAKLPGLKLWAAFAFPRYRQMVVGTESAKIKSLHDKYGDVVRISANSLSFCSSPAWHGKSLYRSLISPS